MKGILANCQEEENNIQKHIPIWPKGIYSCRFCQEKRTAFNEEISIASNTVRAPAPKYEILMLLSNKKTCDPSQADIITMIDDSKLRNSSLIEVSDLSARIRRLHSSATAGTLTRFLRSFLLYDSITTVDRIVKSGQMGLKQNKTPVTSLSFTMLIKNVNLFS